MNRIVKYWILVITLSLSYSWATAQLQLPQFVSDGMVLQRDAKVNIWGWAHPSDSVHIVFPDTTYHAQACLDGKWTVQLKEYEAGGPIQVSVETADSTIVIKNILFGDVWICSGQSNMELPIKRVLPLYKEEVSHASNSKIRYFEVPKTYNFKKAQTNFKGGKWEEVTPESILSISAVVYFFANDLFEKYNVPIGLINASLGGSPIEAWMSEELLQLFPAHYNEMQRFKNDQLIKEIESADQKRSKDWHEKLNEKDKGLNGSSPWYSLDVEKSDWEIFQIPGYWANNETGTKNGVAWFQKTINIPDSLQGHEAKLNMGRIVDADQIYINGQLVGSTGYQYPPRWYDVPKGVLSAGENSIVIRIINESGYGGFVQDKPYEITIGDLTIDLKGEWHWKMGAEMDPSPSQTFVRWKPGGLYNAMIAPLLNLRMKGVIWYQGESNIGRAQEYYDLFPAMIKSWREEWHQGDFPFLFVQLANLNAACNQPCESDIAQLRDAQTATLKLPNTAMAVTYDIGEWNDIHPLNKKDVGRRLSLAAQKVAYNEDVVYSGPQLSNHQIKKGKVHLKFNNAEQGLIAKGESLGGFSIAGEDGNFVWAESTIKNGEVIVWSNSVSHPKKVRYGWADNPDRANLYNKSGLPAIPFSIDL